MSSAADENPPSDWLRDSGAECLATRLRRAADRHATRLRSTLRAAGLPDFEPGWWPLFRLIAERRDLTPSHAASALGLSAAAISQTAAALVRAGLLNEHDDPHDARICHLRLSSEGQKCLPKLSEAAHAANLQLAAALGADAASWGRALDALESVTEGRGRPG